MTRFTLLLLTLAPLAASLRSQDPGSIEPPPEVEVLDLRSAYAPHPFRTVTGQAFEASLVGPVADGAAVTLRFDPNRCTLGALGDPSACTEIAWREIPAKLVASRMLDPLRRGRRLFRVDGDGLEGRLFLVAAGEDGEGWRLMQRTQDGRGFDWILVLEPRPLPQDR